MRPFAKVKLCYFDKIAELDLLSAMCSVILQKFSPKAHR